MFELSLLVRVLCFTLPSVRSIFALAPMAVVRTLDDACRWPLHFLGRDSIQARHDHTQRLLTAEVTTAFSGICAPTVSMHMLGACISSFRHEQIKLDYSGAIDFDAHCRDELRMLPNPPAHIFADILSFVTADTMTILQHHKHYTLDILDEVFLKRPSVSLSASCCLHADGGCTLKAGWIHIAGIPCQDWSSQGKKNDWRARGWFHFFVGSQYGANC